MNDPQSRLFAEALATLTPEEAYAISLCVGWIVAMSSGEMLDEAQRMKYGRIAMRGLTRAFGIRHHDALRSLADHYALAAPAAARRTKQMSKRPPTFDEAAERGLLTEKGIGTFSNGSEWDGWSSGNCYECRWFDPDVAGKYCAFESAAFLGMVSPALATMFGWILDEQYGEFDAPEQCAFFRDKDERDEDRPSVAPVDPAQITFLVPDGFPDVVPEPVFAHA